MNRIMMSSLTKPNTSASNVIYLDHKPLFALFKILPLKQIVDYVLVIYTNLFSKQNAPASEMSKV